MTSNIRRISGAEYSGALAAGRTEGKIEIPAQAVRYVPERDAIEIVTSHNAGFLIPRRWIGALQDVPTEELGRLEVWPDGSAIELEDRDVHISVNGLLTAILPAMLPSRSVAATFASRGGQGTSRAKRKSSRANVRKGGRPERAHPPKLRYPAPLTVRPVHPCSGVRRRAAHPCPRPAPASQTAVTLTRLTEISRRPLYSVAKSCRKSDVARIALIEREPSRILSLSGSNAFCE
jgi:hypothetical protein